jgi:outer membrane receptor protein involved in Fe transport
MHNFSFSYTRKTTYPRALYFDGKKVYLEESFWVGNPSLKPTLTDAFELSWAKYADRLGSMSIKSYFNNAINAVNIVSDVDYDPLWNRVVPYTIPVNLNKYFEAGGEFNVTYRPSPTFNVKLEANVYDSHIETYYDKTQDSLISSSMWAYNVRLGTWVKLWNKLEFHATAYYNSPTQTLFAISQTAYGIDFGELSQGGLVYEVADNGLIGVAHKGAYDHASAETNVMCGLQLIPENTGYIGKFTFTPDA